MTMHELRGARARTRCECGHLLPNHAHLLAVGIVRGETKHFLTQRCSRASTRSGFA